MELKFEKNKKGELTTQQLVTIIILVTSFVVILFLLFRLNLGETSQKEICHNSVVLQAKSSKLIWGLDCSTNYLCVSGGESCEGLSATTTADVNIESKDEIMDVLAEEMADCWWMFGQGELSYLKNDWEGTHCAICAITEFDETIQNSREEISYSDFYDYLEKTTIKNNETYLNYLYGYVGSEDVDDLNGKLDLASEKIDISSRYVIVTGINPNWPREDGIVRPWIVKSDEVTSKTDCEVFDITKA